MRNSNKKVLAYIVGVALGDGNLSNPNGRAVRLRITCSTEYPNLIKKISTAIQVLLPTNKVSLIKRRATYYDISCYSNQWELWLGWKVGNGSKVEQNVSIPNWIKQNKKLSIECLRGLLETDGSVYLDRGYKMVNFVTVISILAKDVHAMMTNLGFKTHLYKVETKTLPKYTIRLSKDVNKFIKTIKFYKD